LILIGSNSERLEKSLVLMESLFLEVSTLFNISIRTAILDCREQRASLTSFFFGIC
jgi:hypothetical protein